MTEALRDAVAAGDRQTCIEVLARMNASERRALAPAAQKLCQDLWSELWSGENYKSEPLQAAHAAAALVAVVTSTPSELARLIKWRIPPEAVDALARLAPPWLGEAAEAFAAVDPLNYDVARTLVRRGLSVRPTHDNYVLGLLQDTRFGQHPFDADPGLLEHEVWRLFEVEGGGERSLAARDKYTQRPQSWAEAFLRQLREGKLDRQRLLDATLGALERDFAPFRAGWFTRFHDDLAPTTDELLARTDRYLRLLHSAVPATVTLAFAAVRAIDAVDPLPPERLVPALEPMCLSRHKGTATAAIKALRQLARRAPASGTLVAPVLAQALAHEAVEVQKAALDGLDQLAAAGTSGLAELIAPRALGVAASLRARLRGFGMSAAPVPAVDAPVVATATSPTDPAFALTPIDRLDELVQAFSSLLENDEEPDEVERVLDGVARLGAIRPPDFAARVGPLAKRARQIEKWVGERPLLVSLVVLARAFTAPPGQARATLEQSGFLRSAGQRQVPMFLAVLVRRLTALAAQLDGGGDLPLLSAPTHRGGWLAPGVFVQRLLDRKAAPFEPIDLYLALLRLAPGGRAEALRRLEPAAGAEHLAATRYALGGDAEIGPTAALWAAACRARAPDVSDARVERRHPGLGPDGGVAAAFTWSMRVKDAGGRAHHELERTRTPRLPALAAVPAELIAVRRHFHASERWDPSVGHKGYNRWAATAWPAGSESFLGGVVQNLADNLDWWEARWHEIAYFELLCAPFLRFGPMATLTLALGLAAKEPGQSRTSADAAIAALASQRLTGARLGSLMSELRAAGFGRLKRWATTLRSVAEVSPLHAGEVSVALQACLRGDPADAPREEGALVGLLVELLAEQEGRITDGEAWEYLQASKHRKKFAAHAP